MSKKNREKIPATSVSYSSSKNPQALLHTEERRPEFRADEIDRSGPWGWDNFDPTCVQEVFQKIFETQKLTWQILGENGSHPVSKTDLCSEAQKRLNQLQKQVECLFSLRLTGKKRIWGIKEGNIFWLLWWDPNHEVCPSFKKHT